MDDLIFFLVLILLITFFIGYKIITSIIDIYNYKKGFKLKADIVFLEWVNSPPGSFSYLYPKEQLKVSYKFELNDRIYEKTEYDIHFKFKKINFKYLPKVGNEIYINIPKNAKINKITINEIDKTLSPIVFLLVLFVFCLSITCLVLANI